MKHIIVVDDDAAVRDAFCMILVEAGYAATAYPDGQMLIRNDFTIADAIIIDKQLTGADGLDICRLLKSQANTRHVPIIVVSASPMVHKLALAAGADDFLEKPFKMTTLLQMVNKHINKGRSD